MLLLYSFEKPSVTNMYLTGIFVFSGGSIVFVSSVGGYILNKVKFSLFISCYCQLSICFEI